MLQFRTSGQISFLSNHRTITAKCPNKSGSGMIALCPEESIHIAIHTAKLWKKQISLLSDRSPFFIVFKGSFVCLTLYRLLVVYLQENCRLSRFSLAGLQHSYGIHQIYESEFRGTYIGKKHLII